MTIIGIDHIQISAPRGSEARVREFYSGLLGLTEISKPLQLQGRGGVWFETGNLPLHIGSDDPPANDSARRHVAFRVADLDAVRETLIANGHAVEEDQAPLEGRRRFYCRDTVGNRVEFVEVLTAAGGPLLIRPELLDEYPAGDGDVDRLALSPDGAWLAAGTSNDGGYGKPGVFVWRFGQPRDPEVEIELAASAWELAFSPNGRELACLSEDGSLETWRVGDFESDQFAELPESSAGLVYASDGGLLAVGAGDKVELYRPGLDHLGTLRPRLGAINALAFDQHDTLAISGETDRIQLWQVRPVQKSSWEVLGHESYATHLKFSPAHPALAAITESDQLLLWDINQSPEAPLDLTGDMTNLNALAFSPDGELLAVGDEDGQVCLWNWQARQPAARLETHAPVLALAFSPDGARLVVGHESGRVRVWKIK